MSSTWPKVLLLFCAAAAAAAAAASRESLNAARFEASVPAFVDAFAAAWADHVRAHGLAGTHNDDNGTTTKTTKPSDDKRYAALMAPLNVALRRAPLALPRVSELDECDDCKAEVRRVQAIWLSPAVKQRVADAAKRICINLNLFAEYICNGAVDLFDEVVIQIIAHSALEPAEYCGLNGVCPYEAAPTWNVSFPSPKPTLRTPPTITPETPRFYILQLTDVHYDPKYTAGLEAVCGDPICCRPPNNVGTTRPAGRFGDFNCDAPRELIVSALEFLSTSPDVPRVDAIFWTGDIPPHDVWESTREGYAALMAEQASLLQQYFPAVPVYAAIGNHESPLVDTFAPLTLTNEEFGAQWLYDVLARQWAAWLPTDAQEQLRRGGSFTTLLRPGLRIVSVNDEGCSNNNKVLLFREEGACCKLEVADPDNTLHWLVDVLQAAEDNKERVFLLRHVKNSSRCNVAWATNFYNIVVRYESTIIALFHGHSHDDYFGVYYRDAARTQAAAVSFVSPALTPYSNGNPTARIYEVSADSFDIINVHTIIANLTEGNQSGRMQWVFEYNALDAYRMPNVAPQAWHDLTVRFESDQALFNRYFEYKLRQNTNGQTCTGTCVAAEVCNLRASSTAESC